MKRAMSVWFPRLPLDLLLRRERRGPDGQAILIVTQDGQRRVVACCCDLAAKAGVHAGMTLGDARGVLRVPCRLEDLRPDRVRVALRALAVWGERFSPMAAVDEPDGLLLDVSGCGPVFGGEERLLARVHQQCAALGFRTRAAIAPSFGCAWALTRFGKSPSVIVPDDAAAEAMAPLPTRALRLEEKIAEALHEVGIERVGQLFNLPRSLLPARFGDAVLLSLDQALGRGIEVIEPVRPVEPPRAERVFDGPCTQVEAIDLTVRDLLRTVAGQLRQRESGARRIDLALKRADLPPASLAVSLSRPSRDARHLWSLVAPKLERINLGFGIEEIRITAARIARLPHEQIREWEDEKRSDERAAGELLDTLANRLGPERVRRAVCVSSHIPERACRFWPVTAQAPPEGEAVPAERPPMLFERPHPAEVVILSPDGPVLRVSWEGRDHAAATSIGPERIAPEWWRHDEPERDYFTVQEEHGRWIWLFRQLQTGRWFVHGVWA